MKIVVASHRGPEILALFVGSVVRDSKADFRLSGQGAVPQIFSARTTLTGKLFSHANLHGGSVKPFFGSSVVRAYRPFPRTGKLGATPGTRAAWNLQTRLKSAPESVTRCKQWLTSGSTKQAIRRRFSTCDVLARKGLRSSLKQVLSVQVP